MSQPNRFSNGGIIDRSLPISFYFNGKQYQGYKGDTLASALIANGVSVTARSFKYHRPRGIVGLGIEEPASMVELEGDFASGNNPITIVPIQDGLRANSINCWPSVNFDFGAVTQLFAKLMPAGFYYKTFKWPNWHLFEPSIRRAAGLAGAPELPPAQCRFEARHAHTDILIVGAGAAGLMAALTAGRTGARVFLVDEGLNPGGSLLNRALEIDGAPATDWVSKVVTELDAMDNFTYLKNATAWAYREHNMIIVNERSPKDDGVLERSWRIRAGQVICATGAIERALVFANNDRPGVMMASAIQGYVNRYAVRPGKRAVMFTNNNSSYAAAADMVKAGIEIVAIVDSRASVPAEAMALVKGLNVLEGFVVTTVKGYKRVKSVTVEPRHGGASSSISCDLLGQSGGWNPTVHLFSQSRGTLKYNEDIASFEPDTPVEATLSIGAAAGLMTLQDALDTGFKAGIDTANKSGFSGVTGEVPDSRDLAYKIEPLWRVENTSSKGKAFLDIQNDVSVDDVHLALREGYTNIEHVKRYTTAGMGIDQGKVGNINIIGTVALQTGGNPQDIGITTFRSPYTPVSFGAIGGLREDTVAFPYRHTPITQWNRDRGAVIYEAGARWQRPGYFPCKGETFQDAVNREALSVRNGVGVYDGSPLGTFELKGRDVGKFLDFIYTNIMSNLKPGNGRYGLMLSDDGLILDDGVTFRVDENRWLVSTSTGNADSINQHMEKLLQTEYPNWEVKITSVTSQWNNATICGPKARQLLGRLGTNIDISPEAFKFMSFRDGRVAGMRARVVRVSFTGELSFEINVAPRDLLELWLKIMDAGKPLGIEPVGSEANHVLRVEKGFLSLGHEVDGTIDAHDLGMGWAMSKKKPDYLGKRSVALRRAGGGVRKELVGLLPINPNTAIPEGAPLTPDGRKEATEGLTTACVWSVTNNCWVALALLKNGHARHGQTVHVRLRDEIIPAKVTAPIHYDPTGEKMRS